jgi:hypothetical protein
MPLITVRWSLHRPPGRPLPGVGETAHEHRGGRRDVAEVAAQDRPAGLEVFALGQQVAHPHHVGEGALRLGQRGLDVAQALLGLLHHVVGDRHGGVVEPGRPGHMHPAAVDHGADTADLLLKGRAAEDRASLCHVPNGK